MLNLHGVAGCRYSIDLNRHSPYEWKPEGGQAGAGPYPMYLPQGRAVYEALVKRNNIATLQSYHTSGAMVLHNGPSVTGTVSIVHLYQPNQQTTDMFFACFVSSNWPLMAYLCALAAAFRDRIIRRSMR